MNRFMCLIVLALLLGCGVFKTKKLTHSTDFSSYQEAKMRTKKQLFLIHDSIRDDVIIEIVPIGTFSYSLNEGFSGRGSSIKITGKKNSTTEVVAQFNSSNIHQQAEKKTSTKKMSDMGVKHDGFKLGIGIYRFLLCLVMVLIAACWWIFRKRKLF